LDFGFSILVCESQIMSESSTKTEPQRALSDLAMNHLALPSIQNPKSKIQN